MASTVVLLWRTGCDGFAGVGRCEAPAIGSEGDAGAAIGGVDDVATLTVAAAQAPPRRPAAAWMRASRGALFGTTEVMPCYKSAEAKARV